MMTTAECADIIHFVGVTATRRVAKRLYGQDTAIRGYKSRRKSLLDGVPHIRLVRGVVLLRDQDAAALRALLTELGCTVRERRVELTPDDTNGLCDPG